MIESTGQAEEVVTGYAMLQGKAWMVDRFIRYSYIFRIVGTCKSITIPPGQDFYVDKVFLDDALKGSTVELTCGEHQLTLRNGHMRPTVGLKGDTVIRLEVMQRCLEDANEEQEREPQKT